MKYTKAPTGSVSDEEETQSEMSAESEESMDGHEERYEAATVEKYLLGSTDMDISDDEDSGEKVENGGVSSINPEAHEEPGSVMEQAGVVHLVHGWIQQGQAKKVRSFHEEYFTFKRRRRQGLFISSDISKTSTSLAAAKSYFKSTESIAFQMGCFLKQVFPQHHERFKKAFDAGCMFGEDPGPFYARAIIYKLQGKLHKDKRDAGPSASVGVGNYEGGKMYFPQLGTKVQ